MDRVANGSIHSIKDIEKYINKYYSCCEHNLVVKEVIVTQDILRLCDLLEVTSICNTCKEINIIRIKANYHRMIDKQGIYIYEHEYNPCRNIDNNSFILKPEDLPI